MKTNMSTESLTAKRIIKDHMLANKLKPHTIALTKPFVQAFRSGRQKCEVHLEQKSEAEVRAMYIAADIEKLRVTQKQKQKAVEMMEKEVIECMEKVKTRTHV